MTSKLALLAFPALFVGLCGAGPESLQSTGRAVMVLGNGQAQTCASHAFLAADGKMSPNTAVQTCTDALAVENLSSFDQAATFNNRGVIRLSMLDEASLALEDFNAAVKIDPDLAESYVNRGAALIQAERWADAITELDRGLAMGPRQPWRAHFNRAIARESLGDVQGAYADYKKAQELKPDWERPTQELARFQVRAAN